MAAIMGLCVSTPANAQTYVGKVRAVDGDSLEIGEARFRLFGIDAVEKHQTCDRDGQAWSCGADASSAFAALVERGSVNCTQRSTDQYGRIVATCLVGGYDLGEQMVRQGYAVALRDFSSAYVSAEEAARSRGVGIWSSEFQMLSEFRAGDTHSVAERQAMIERKARSDRQHQAELRQANRAAALRAVQETGVYYRNCTEARAAGATPLYRGLPGYGAHMDGDGDGVACEPYRGRP
ncbi:excalibur calcium-binding domain-containing protein [Qipengyuania sp. 902]|uniref:excalibur calcium-binding domain-containing protein n=1 Tax=Qipengyuania sp. 902 TaxID=3417565 RepID=UPI003EBD362E